MEQEPSSDSSKPCPDILVCGTGPSLDFLVRLGPGDFHTVGVNDIGRHFHPNHLVVIDQPGNFGPERRKWVLGTQASTVWIPGGWEHLHHPDVRMIPWKGLENDHPEIRPEQLTDHMILACKTSVFTATQIAFRLRPRRIGLIGVDLDTHWQLHSSVTVLNRRFGELSRAMEWFGVGLFNCSPISALTSLRRMDLESFRATESRSLSLQRSLPHQKLPHG